MMMAVVVRAALRAAGARAASVEAAAWLARVEAVREGAWAGLEPATVGWAATVGRAVVVVREVGRCA